MRKVYAQLAAASMPINELAPLGAGGQLSAAVAAA
jgi:hypothetical protein